MNDNYMNVLKTIWKKHKFQKIAWEVGREIGTHSIQTKVASTSWAAEHGMNPSEFEICDMDERKGCKLVHQRESTSNR